MDHKENPVQPESELTADEQLDLLLEKFLAEDTEQEVAIEEAAISPVEEAAPAAQEQVIEETPATETVDTEDAPSLAEEAPVLMTDDALWEDQQVDIPVLAEEIGPDELVAATAGLTRPEDLEFEKIMSETLQEAAEETAPAAENEEEDFSLPDEFFLPVERTSIQEETNEAEPDYPEVDLTAVLQQQAAQMELELQEEEAAQMATEEETEEDALPQEPVKKRRPKKSHTYGFFGIPHMITTAIWLALILFIGAGLGNMIWQVAADMLAFGRPNQTVTITITSADDLDSIAQKLQDTGLIKYPGIFKFYGEISNAEKKVKPGTYELNTIFDYMALVKHMSGTAVRVSTKVVIPEGYTCQQIFRLLERSGVCTVESLEEAVRNADLSDYWFLEGIDQSQPNCLEGYLFPDTYEFYLDHNPSQVLHRLLNTFEKRFTDEMAAKIDALNESLADMMRGHGLSESYIQNNLFTIREVVIVASMIEKETSGDAESYNIASVIYNRLTNPGGETAGFLQIDATLVYINGGNNPTNADKEINSPYNTYMYKGLPAGAISNPGLASLNAALSPENTEYYFYALDPTTGSHKFFKTYKAHQNFLESLNKGD